MNIKVMPLSDSLTMDACPITQSNIVYLLSPAIIPLITSFIIYRKRETESFDGD